MSKGYVACQGLQSGTSSDYLKILSAIVLTVWIFSFGEVVW